MGTRVIKLSVDVTRYADFLGIEGLFTQGSRPSRTFGDSVGGLFEKDNSDWSNGQRYHNSNTRHDIEFKSKHSTDIAARLALILRFSFRRAEVEEVQCRWSACSQ
jgi:hypothetical protein